ncbi:hypothetical protein [Streptomyces sp. NPDC045251]|uniref:hypothetical protein n=1 Tax=unclassified Streptomyces TaxID=2593676 RepID=UPI0033DE1C56
MRISVDGNAHFCRGLLRTRCPDSAADQAPRSRDDGNPEDATPAAHRTTIKENTA